MAYNIFKILFSEKNVTVKQRKRLIPEKTIFESESKISALQLSLGSTTIGNVLNMTYLHIASTCTLWPLKTLEKSEVICILQLMPPEKLFHIAIKTKKFFRMFRKKKLSQCLFKG